MFLKWSLSPSPLRLFEMEFSEMELAAQSRTSIILSTDRSGRCCSSSWSALLIARLFLMGGEGVELRLVCPGPKITVSNSDFFARIHCLLCLKHNLLMAHHEMKTREDRRPHAFARMRIVFLLYPMLVRYVEMVPKAIISKL